MKKIGKLAATAIFLATLATTGQVAAQNHASLVEGARKEGRLNVATSAPGDGFPRFLAKFKEKYPFIDVTTGFFTAPTGRVLARVGAEIDARNLTIDIVHVANMAAYIDMQSKGQLAEYMSAEYKAMPAGTKHDGYWATARAIGVIMTYNKNKLSEADAPKSWKDLLSPKWKDKKFALQGSASGTSFSQLYQLEELYGPDFIKQLAAQSPVVMNSGGQIIDAVSRGEILLGGAIDHWTAFTSTAQQAGLMPIFPTDGTPISLSPVAIVKGNPNPNAAKLFMDYVLSQEGQKVLNTDIFGLWSVRADVPPPAGQKSMTEAKALLPKDMGKYQAASSTFAERFQQTFR